MLSLTPACSRGPSTRFSGVPAGFRVKGTYYFQPKAPVNSFWSWLNIERAKSDFRQLRDDGFNTIILMVPWGLFQPSIHPITYNGKAFHDLNELLTLANSSGLKVILRLGSHDYIPRGAGGVRWAAATVLTNEEEWAAYRELFREVAGRARSYSNVLAAFWTFEDAGYTPDVWLHRYPTNVTAFRQWLRRKPLIYWNGLWGESNAGYDAIEAPDRSENSKKLFSFAQFGDELIANRMPDVCAAIADANPALLVGFQPRAEVEFGYDYARQFELPRCYGFVTTWFSPYQAYMFGYAPQNLSGDRVANYVPDYVARTARLSHGMPVLVDQFNFRHFGGIKGESALGSEDEELKFVSTALPSLLQMSAGYALWNYQDYYLSIIYNGSFRFGLDEWETSPAGVQVVETGRGQSGVEIQPRSWIREQVSVSPEQEYTLEFDAEGEGQTIEVGIHFPVTQQSTEKSFRLLKERQSFQWKVKAPPAEANAIVTFMSGRSTGSIRIRDILMYPWIDTGGIYTIDGHPRVRLRDLFRKINLEMGN